MKEQNNVQISMSYAEMTAKFRAIERKGEHLPGYIVFTPDSFDIPYDERGRTYGLSSDNKAFQPNMGGYSIYGYSSRKAAFLFCLDGFVIKAGQYHTYDPSDWPCQPDSDASKLLGKKISKQNTQNQIGEGTDHKFPHFAAASQDAIGSQLCGNDQVERRQDF